MNTYNKVFQFDGVVSNFANYLFMRCWLLLIFCLAVNTIQAQSWRGLFTAAQEAYEAGNSEEAIKTGTDCLNAFKKEDGAASENYASILRLLGNANYAIGEYAKGLVFIEQELVIREAKQDINYASALDNAAQFQNALGEYGKATMLLQKARGVLELFHRADDAPLLLNQLAIASTLYLSGNSTLAYENFKSTFSQLSGKSVNADDLLTSQYYFGLASLENNFLEDAAICFNWLKEYYELNDDLENINYHEALYNLGDIRLRQLQLTEAETLLVTSQKFFESRSQTSEELYAKVVNARALCLQKLGRSTEASALFDVLEKSGGGLSSSIALSNKAAIAQQMGKLAEAEKLYRDALKAFGRSTETELLAYAETAQNLSVLLTELGRYDEAIVLLDDALGSMKQAGKEKGGKVSSIFAKKGLALLREGKYADALKNYQSAYDQSTRSSDEWIIASNGIAVIYQQTGDFTKADSVVQEIFASYNQGIKEDMIFASVLNNYAALKQVEGQLLTSRDLLQQATVITRKNAGRLNLSYATALENLAYVNLQMGELRSAKLAIDSVMIITSAILGDKSEEYASALINLGRYYQYAGEFSNAEPQFKKAIAILEQSSTGTQAEKIRATNGLATFYLTMGNYDEAEPLYIKSRKLIESQFKGDHPEYSTTLQNLATLYQLQDKFSEAEILLKQSLELDKKTFGERHPQYAISLQNLATVYQKQAQFDKAQPLLEQVLKVTEASVGKDHPSYSITLSNLASLYQDTKQPEKAEKAWRESVEIRKRVLGEDHPDYARSLYGLATIAFAKGEYTEAKTLYENVVQKYLEQIRENFPSMSEKEKGAFYAKIKPVFDTYQDFCVQYYSRNSQNPEAAMVLKELYDIQLATKAILLNATNKVRSRILTSGDAALVLSFEEWIKIKEEVVRFYTLSEEERKGQNIDITALQQKANDLEKVLSSKSELFKSQFDQDVIKTEQVASALQADEAAVEIIRLKRKFERDSIYYIGLVLKPNQTIPSLVIWPYGVKLETRLYRYHRNTIKFKIADTLSYKHFWQPLENQLQGTRHVYISSDGIFNKVNLNTLQNVKTSAWVLDNYSIGLVSNTSEVYSQQHKAESSSKGAFLFGAVDFNNNGVVASGTTRSLARTYGFTDNEIPNLPATEKEVDEINTLLAQQQWEARSFKIREASEENLKGLDNPKLIHIATHGYFMSDIDIDDRESDEVTFFNNPLLRSGILLAGAAQRRQSVSIESGEDGALSAYEAMNLYLDNTDLVVLSACETGLGEVRNGEGVYGLQRSFLVAGSKAVMMSLWQVDDQATQELMVKFYTLWLNTGNQQEAFRQAQIAMKAKFNDPYFWGAFIMIGK